MSKHSWKIFQVNDVDWFVAKSPDEARATAKMFYASIGNEDEVWEDPVPLTDEQLDKHTFYDDLYNQEDSPKRTFRHQLDALIAEGNMEADMFATSEW